MNAAGDKTTPGMEIDDLDKHIEGLLKCIPLPESTVKVLCEKA